MSPAERSSFIASNTLYCSVRSVTKALYDISAPLSKCAAFSMSDCIALDFARNISFSLKTIPSGESWTRP